MTDLILARVSFGEYGSVVESLLLHMLSLSTFIAATLLVFLSGSKCKFDCVVRFCVYCLVTND